MTWSVENSQAYESRKIVWELPQYCRGRGLDLGCGPWKAMPHMIGVDSNKDEKLFGSKAVGADLIIPDASNLDMFAPQSMDFVYSSHLLEHIEDHGAALREWWRLIKVGGYLVLYLPHKDLYPNIGQEGSNPDHVHDFTEHDIINVMIDIGGWDLKRCELRDQDDEYSMFLVFCRAAKPNVQEYSYRSTKPLGPHAAVIRYGAWGDSLQSASVLAGLKAQGYHVTLYTTPRGLSVVEHDPNIDAFYIQDEDQVPPHWLPEFLKQEAKKFDKFVNLCGTVEETWLAIPGTVFYDWPHEVRHKYKNENYVQFQHEVAGIPYEKPLTKFYPTLKEKSWVHEQKRHIRGAPLVAFAGSGSSIHKVWPHMDSFLAKILVGYPNAKIVFLGGDFDEVLAEPWRNERRVINKCGAWGIRETLAFAQAADIVIGPETGVLNSVAMEPIPKVVILSHSSHENLTRDWENTLSVFSTKTSCYPCHKMHYHWDTCNRNEEWGTAQCAADVPSEAVFAAFQRGLSMKRKEAA